MIIRIVKGIHRIASKDNCGIVFLCNSRRIVVEYSHVARSPGFQWWSRDNWSTLKGTVAEESLFTQSKLLNRYLPKANYLNG